MTIEDTFAKFQKNFEEVTLTLIADLNKINESLGRVTESVDLIEKLRIQMSENKQNLGQLEKQVKSLIQRLDKMSAGGFQIPEAPLTPSPRAASSDNLLNMQFTPKTSTEPVDDLEKEFGPLPDNLQAKPAVKPTPKVEEPKPIEKPVIVESELIEDEKIEIPDIPLPPPTPVAPKPVPKASPTTPLPPTASGLAPLSPLPRMPGSIAPLAPVEVAPGAPTQKKTENPSTAVEIFNNLIGDLQTVRTQGEAGDCVLKAKDVLSKKIQFNTSYFEMLMYGGPLKAKKDAPFTPDLLKQGIDKIKFWMSKF